MDDSHYALSFEGTVTQPPIEIAARRYRGSMQEMMPKVGEGFGALFSACGDKPIKDRPLMVCEEFDEQGGSISLIMGIPTSNAAFDGFERVDVAGGLYFRAVLRGNYENLRRAWGETMQHVEQGHAYDARRLPYEIYDNDPQQVEDPADYRTSLYVPIKQ